MEKTKKIGFFKRVKMAIFELENYIEFINYIRTNLKVL